MKIALKLLHQLPPETAHTIALKSLNLIRLIYQPEKYFQPFELSGLTFYNRLGLAAGFDKNADYLPALSRLGFGSIEVGTVTPRPQIGNPQPRLFRLPEHQALINRMGFNNKGIDYLKTKLESFKNTNQKFPIGVNIGKNKDTENSDANKDYLHCYNKICQLADYVAVNVSSPNTAGLRDLQTTAELEKILTPMLNAQTKSSNNAPIYVKLSPDLNDEQIVNIIDQLIKLKIKGVIVTNTTLDKTTIEGAKFATEQGGLSGKPLGKRASQVIELVAKQNQKKQLVLISVGGITTIEDAQSRLAKGADLIQIYSSFIYQGVGLVHKLATTP